MKRTLAMLAAILLPFVAISASYTNSFVRNGVTYVQRGGLTIKDYVVTNVTSSGGSSITTNDVCNIVTNVVVGWSEWHYKWYNVDTGISYPTNFGQITWNGSEWVTPSDFPPNMGNVGDTTDPDLSLIDYEDGSDNGIEATRILITRNALGLARLIDLPPLTNDVPSMISSAAQDATNYTDSATGAYLKMTNGTGSVVWDDSDRLTVDNGTLTVGIGEIYASAGTISFEGTSDGFTYNSSPVATVDTLSLACSEIAQASTNYTDSSIANADTTYTRFSISTPTNVNQSVQYVNIADENPSVLSVVIPEGTGTKDWLIYVMSQTNVTISLPAATWWMADVAYTNDIAPATPTALYFSQIDTGLFLFSRQELSPVTIPAP